MRARWALELSAALLAVALVVWLWPRSAAPIASPQTWPKPSVPTPPRDQDDRAVELRERAVRSCELGRYQECLRALDEAKSLDPVGDAQPSIVDVRSRAAEMLMKLAEPKPTVTKPTVTKPTKAKSTGSPSTGTSG